MCSTVLHTILHRLDYDTQHIDCHWRYNSGFFIETIMENLRLLFVFAVRLFSKLIFFFYFALEGQEILYPQKSSCLAVGPIQLPFQWVQSFFPMGKATRA